MVSYFCSWNVGSCCFCHRHQGEDRSPARDVLQYEVYQGVHTKSNTYLDVQTKVDGKKGLKFVRDTMKALAVLGKGGLGICRRMLEVRSPMFFFLRVVTVVT